MNAANPQAGTHEQIAVSPRMRDLTGLRFGRLIVLGLAATRTPSGTLKWNTRCDCGRHHVANGGALRCATTTSCGCRALEVWKRTKLQHGLSHSREHKTWSAMLGRAHFGTADCAHHYLGRGITVCERWLRFENFFADMGVRPPGMTLERINNNGNYEPSNCRWATQLDQQRNRRFNRWLTAFGKTLLITDWAAALGISRQAISYRLSKGWPIERALSARRGEAR